MQTIHSRRIIVLLLVATLLVGCAIHRPTIREYHTGQGGQVSVTNVTEEQYWKERVDERIAAEIAKQKPEAGYDSYYALASGSPMIDRPTSVCQTVVNNLVA